MADVNYTRVNWEDSPSTDTPINATNLNVMDVGIENVATRANASVPYENILDDWTDINAVTTPNTYVADAMRVAELNTNLTAVEGTLAIGATSITLTDARLTATSNIIPMTSIWGVNPLTITKNVGNVVMTFYAQSEVITVGVEIHG